MSVHHVPPEIDATILALCESLEALLEHAEALLEHAEALLEHADMGEIHDDETREAVERAKLALASALALRLCVAQ